MITSNDRSLGAIAEENTKEIEKDIDEDMKDDVAAMNAKQSDEVYEVTNTKQGLTEDELSILSESKLFSITVRMGITDTEERRGDILKKNFMKQETIFCSYLF